MILNDFTVNSFAKSPRLKSLVFKLKHIEESNRIIKVLNIKLENATNMGDRFDEEIHSSFDQASTFQLVPSMF